MQQKRHLEIVFHVTSTMSKVINNLDLASQANGGTIPIHFSTIRAK